MVFLWFSYGFPMVFPVFAYGFTRPGTSKQRSPMVWCEKTFTSDDSVAMFCWTPGLCPSNALLKVREEAWELEEIVDFPIKNGDFPLLCLDHRGYHTKYINISLKINHINDMRWQHVTYRTRLSDFPKVVCCPMSERMTRQVTLQKQKELLGFHVQLPRGTSFWNHVGGARWYTLC